MPVVLFRKDPFLLTDSAVESVKGLSRQNDGVRRPLYGYVPKADRYASLSIVQVTPSTGAQVPVSILDSSAPASQGVRGRSNKNTNFFVTQISHVDSEKFQIVETFGDDYVFFYGRRPFMLQVSGLLLNTEDFDWKSEWLENYETYLRGTKCVENRCRVQFRVDDRLYSGYILTTQVQDSAETPHASPFGFQMLVYSQVDLTTRRVVSLAETRIVGENLYVDYVEVPLGLVDVYEIGADGISALASTDLGALDAVSEDAIFVTLSARFSDLVRTQNVAFIEGLSAVAAPPTAAPRRGKSKGRGIRSGAALISAPE